VGGLGATGTLTPVFGRSKAAEVEEQKALSAGAAKDGGKGRPTPKRREAERGRRRAVIPAGTGVEQRRQLRERQRQERTALVADVLDDLRTRLVALVRAHHEARPLDPGAPRQEVRSKLAVDVALFDELVVTMLDAAARSLAAR